MTYIDKYNLWNVKPVDSEFNPSGNDGMIVTAYASKLGFKTSFYHKFFMLDLKQSHHKYSYPIERLPGKKDPMPSRDFFLGATYFNLMSPSRMKLNGWNFSPKPLPELNIFKLISQLWNLRGKHRNTFWQEPGYEQVYHVACMVPFQDRAYYYRANGENSPYLYALIECIDRMKTPKSNSGALIHWLKYHKKPSKKVFVEYFGADHPFCQVM